MKFSLFFKSLIIPFLMFSLMGGLCDTSEEDSEICKSFKTSKKDVKRLNENSVKQVEVVGEVAKAECSARFLVKFGWEDPIKFTSSNVKSPLDEDFAGLVLTLGEKNFNNTFSSWSVSGPVGDFNPDTEPGFVWFVELPVEAVASEGSTRFFVKIEHDILDTEFNFFVDVHMEYSSD